MSRRHADAISRYRKRKGLSVRALARRLGVEHSTILAWEQAKIPQALFAGLRLGADPVYWHCLQIPTEELAENHARALQRVRYWNQVVAGVHTEAGVSEERAREELAIAFALEQAAKRALDQRQRVEGV